MNSNSQQQDRQVIFAGEKSPLPINPYTELSSERLGSCHHVEFFLEVCSCGRRLSHLAYPIGVHVAKASIERGISSQDALVEYMNSHHLKMCCRNNIVSPTVELVVIRDIGAKWVESIVMSEQPVIVDAPPVIVGIDPPRLPPLLSATPDMLSRQTGICESSSFLPSVVRTWDQR